MGGGRKGHSEHRDPRGWGEREAGKGRRGLDEKEKWVEGSGSKRGRAGGDRDSRPPRRPQGRAREGPQSQEKGKRRLREELTRGKKADTGSCVWPDPSWEVVSPHRRQGRQPAQRGDRTESQDPGVRGILALHGRAAPLGGKMSTHTSVSMVALF